MFYKVHKMKIIAVTFLTILSYFKIYHKTFISLKFKIV